MPEFLLLEAVCKRLTARLQSQYSGVMERYPLERYVQTLNRRYAFIGYNAIDESVAGLCGQLVRDYSQEALDLYHRSLLLQLLLNNRKKMQSDLYTATVQEQFLRECNRIVRDVECNPVGFYDYENDLFCKDLGVATLRMFPAGVLKTESMAGIPRRIIFSNRGWDLLHWLRHIQRFGGFSPYYEIHLDVRYCDGFTPEGWDAALRIIGEMLLLHPHIKGITGASWFFDPQIRSISPRLNYLRQRAEDNGGRFFFYKRDEHTTELAVSSSPTRRKLYVEGHYQPTSYFMVWPRTDILQWLERDAALGRTV